MTRPGASYFRSMKVPRTAYARVLALRAMVAERGIVALPAALREAYAAADRERATGTQAGRHKLVGLGVLIDLALTHLLREVDPAGAEQLNAHIETNEARRAEFTEMVARVGETPDGLLAGAPPAAPQFDHSPRPDDWDAIDPALTTLPRRGRK